MKNRQIFSFLTIGVSLGMYSCILPNISLASSKIVEIPVKDFVLAKSKIPSYHGIYLELVDVKGYSTNDSYPGPFEGLSWSGQFQLRVVNIQGKIRSTLNLPDNKYVQYIFTRKFQFHFADYNGNGFPDFALGQRQGSDVFDYKLYAVKQSKLYQLPISTVLYVSNFDYSPLFKKVNTHAFQIEEYNNIKSKYFLNTYTWKHGKFILTSVKDAGK